MKKESSRLRRIRDNPITMTVLRFIKLCTVISIRYSLFVGSFFKAVPTASQPIFNR